MNTRTGLPPAVASVAPLVEKRLRDLLDTEVARWSEVDAALGEPFSSLRSSVLSGGKRLRPVLCYWSFIGAGGDAGSQSIVDAGAALELLHSAALIHDDVIDGSDRRHGSPTIHVEQAARHRGRGWRGDPERFGAGVAVLIGDLALVYGDRLLSGAPLQAVGVYDEMRLEVNVGQYLDVLGAADRAGLAGEAGVMRSERIRRYKTAKYTVERPLHLGAALAAPDSFEFLAGGLSDFGLPLGEAFQLRDDLLDVFGDPAVTGKPVGDDLREGKPTLLASLTATRAAGSAGAFFDANFGSPDLDESAVRRLQEIIESTGARSEAEAAIRRLLDSATAALSRLRFRPEAIEALGEVARFVAGRDR
ncbi:MAG TPA: polyprenyl synthetase family protein [Acidimicrobiales bacterium]|nr:polyprenyl synthetase family protein [Acidimicrobiales bacterium]